MKIAILDIKESIGKQIEKVHSEFLEVCESKINMDAFIENNQLLVNKHKHNLQLEALDLLTATMNLINMLQIPEDVIQEHEEKMKGYEKDPTRKYKIVRWCGVDE